MVTSDTLAIAGVDADATNGDDPFPHHLREEYLARARMMTARKGQIICAEGTVSRDVYLICSGRVQFSLLSSLGREVILRDMQANRIFGELAAVDHRPRSASAVATEECRLAHMNGDAFVAFLGEVPQAGLWMVHQLAALLRDMTERAFAFATLPVANRLQAELIRLANIERGTVATTDRRAITKMPTHADLAARIGTHREAVSRELGALAKEGIVQQVGRTMYILSFKSLVALHDRARR
ncbi:MAG: Crp/Fnr family transcriptional regulator [Sphingopyxis sp.]